MLLPLLPTIVKCENEDVHKHYWCIVQNKNWPVCLLISHYVSGQPISKWARRRHKLIHQTTYTVGFPRVFTLSIQLTELPFSIGGVRGRPVRAALSPLPASRRPAVLLPSGYQERSHRSAVSEWDPGQSLLAGSRPDGALRLELRTPETTAQF